jgi:hypothetical protein
MTGARLLRKLHGRFLRIWLALAVALLSGLIQPIGAATTEYVVVDRNSGLAIYGFDPVAYFTDGVASPGDGEFEYGWEGAVWRFRNPGNLGAFVADPDVYMPRFGGYDPTALARGVGVPGDPRLWLIRGKRLYLFSTREARDAFAAEAEEAIATAELNWPSVQLTLTP